jgi:hypothetical protein
VWTNSAAHHCDAVLRCMDCLLWPPPCSVPDAICCRHVVNHTPPVTHSDAPTCLFHLPPCALRLALPHPHPERRIQCDPVPCVFARSELKPLYTPTVVSSPATRPMETPAVMETPANLPTPTSTMSPVGAMPLVAGQRVRAKFQAKTRWYPGEVRHVNEDGTYAVDYDDGDVEEAVKPQHVKVDHKPPSPTKKGGVCTPCVVSASYTMPPQPQPQLAPPPEEMAASEPAAETALAADVPKPKRQRTKIGVAAASSATSDPLQKGENRPVEVYSTERILELLDEVGCTDEPPSRAVVKSISDEVRALHDGQLRELPSAQLRSLLTALQPLVSPTAPVVGERGEHEPAHVESGVEDAERALEAALLAVGLAAVPGMARELLVDEVLEAIVQLTKTQYARLTAVVADSFSPGMKPPAGGKRSPAKQQKRQPKETPEQGMLALLLERLPALVRTGGLNDSLLLQLGQLGLNAAMADSSQLPLQMGGVQVRVVKKSGPAGRVHRTR